MIKKLITLVFIVGISSIVKAAPPNFCSSPAMNSSGCISTCAAMAAQQNGTNPLPIGQYGWCEGVATSKWARLLKIELGKTAIGDSTRCTVWQGDMVVNVGGSIPKTLKSSGFASNLSGCVKGVAYDAWFITVSSSEYVTGYAVFPDGSGKVARTTSTYAAKDNLNPVDPITAWRDSGFSDPNKFYTLPSGLSGWAVKKLGITASESDLNSSSSIEMEWDESRTSRTWGTDTTTRPGFRCSPGDSNDCAGDVPGYSDRYVSIIPIDSPVTLQNDDQSLQFSWVRYRSDRGNNESVGIRFLWVNDGGVLKYVGISTTSDGGNFVIRNIVKKKNPSN